ncbi:MAG: 6-phosphogluconolactonase [Halieaceae bacterium]|jgi:6-phosphogluconolactonase
MKLIQEKNVMTDTDHFNDFETREALAAKLADVIAGNLSVAISRRGIATLAVSGGSTPKPLFRELSTREIDWSRVSVTLVDERWVPEDHIDSNAALVRDNLLQGAARAANFVSMKIAGEDAFGARDGCERQLADFANGIDVVVLGMGDDGHTASFFPGAATLAEALDVESSRLCVAVKPPLAPHDRMTLSLAVIKRSEHLYLHITGASKRELLVQALQVDAVEELPIRTVARCRSDMAVYCAP